MAVPRGFRDAPAEAARAFRAAMNALARPGRIEKVGGAVPPAPLSVAAGVLLLTLVDADTPLHLAGGADRPEVRDWLAFHAAAPLVGPGAAAFAVGRWAALQPVGRFPQGLPDYPDRSATLIVELDRLAPDGVALAGPGVAPGARLSLPERAAFAANNAAFPLGLDVFLTCGDRLAALPRSTRVL